MIIARINMIAITGKAYKQRATGKTVVRTKNLSSDPKIAFE